MTEIDHECTVNIVCPYCGNEDRDSWEVSPGEEDLGLIDCDCGKSFYATRNITITYSTYKANYGTCKYCSSEDVPIENYSSSIGEYKELCAECGYKKKQRKRVTP